MQTLRNLSEDPLMELRKSRPFVTGEYPYGLGILQKDVREFHGAESGPDRRNIARYSQDFSTDNAPIKSQVVGNHQISLVNGMEKTRKQIPDRYPFSHGLFRVVIP